MEDQTAAMDGWREAGIDVKACALKPLHAPHLSCPETHVVFVVIRQGPPGDLIWRLYKTCFQFAFVYAAFAQVARPFAITAVIINPHVKWTHRNRPPPIPPTPCCEHIDSWAMGGQCGGRLPWISHQAIETQRDSFGDWVRRGHRSWHVLSWSGTYLCQPPTQNTAVVLL